jgi:hypothetical protein
LKKDDNPTNGTFYFNLIELLVFPYKFQKQDFTPTGIQAPPVKGTTIKIKLQVQFNNQASETWHILIIFLMFQNN